MEQNNIFSESYERQSFNFFMFIFHLVPCYMRDFSNTREESCESALIIHKILQNKPAFMLNDEIFYNKMKSFTLQILNRKKVLN